MSENSYHSDIRERVQQRLNVLLNMTAEPSKKTTETPLLWHNDLKDALDNPQAFVKSRYKHDLTRSLPRQDNDPNYQDTVDIVKYVEGNLTNEEAEGIVRDVLHDMGVEIGQVRAKIAEFHRLCQ